MSALNCPGGRPAVDLFTRRFTELIQAVKAFNSAYPLNNQTSVPDFGPFADLFAQPQLDDIVSVSYAGYAGAGPHGIFLAFTSCCMYHSCECGQCEGTPAASEEDIANAMRLVGLTFRVVQTAAIAIPVGAQSALASSAGTIAVLKAVFQPYLLMYDHVTGRRFFGYSNDGVLAHALATDPNTVAKATQCIQEVLDIANEPDEHALRATAICNLFAAAMIAFKRAKVAVGPGAPQLVHLERQEAVIYQSYCRFLQSWDPYAASFLANRERAARAGQAGAGPAQ